MCGDISSVTTSVRCAACSNKNITPHVIMDPTILTAYALLAAKVLLVVALFFGAWRLFLGPTLADRVIALDLIAGIVFAFAVIVAVESDEALFLNVAFAIAVVTFLGTVAIARLMERGARS